MQQDIHLLYVHGEAQAKQDHDLPKGPPSSRVHHQICQEPYTHIRLKLYLWFVTLNSSKNSKIKEQQVYLMHVFISFHPQQIMTHSIICPFMNDRSNLKEQIHHVSKIKLMKQNLYIKAKCVPAVMTPNLVFPFLPVSSFYVQ